MTACNTISMLIALNCRIVSPKCFIKSLIDLDCPILMWNRLVRLCFLLIEHIYWVTNFSDNARKEVIVLGRRRWNQYIVGLTRLDGNTFHRRASFPF